MDPELDLQEAQLCVNMLNGRGHLTGVSLEGAVTHIPRQAGVVQRPSCLLHSQGSAAPWGEVCQGCCLSWVAEKPRCLPARNSSESAGFGSLFVSKENFAARCTCVLTWWCFLEGLSDL